MDDGRHVKLFRNGRNQAVRIPREMELPGDDAVIRKDGEDLIISPAPAEQTQKAQLLALLASLEPLHIAWPDFDDPEPEPVEL